MPTPSGQISLNDVNVELGLAGTTLISMNQANVRTLAGVGGSGTPISMQNLQGKSDRVSLSFTYSTNTTNASLNLSGISGYRAGKSDITVTVNSGVYVYATATSNTGLDISGGTTGDTLTVVNNGFIMGMGGNAAGASGSSKFGSNSGGRAMNIASLGISSTTITNTSGYIGGGGGGGGYGNGGGGFEGNGGGGGAGGGNGGSGSVNQFKAGIFTAPGGTGGNPGASGNNGSANAADRSIGSGGGGGGRIMPGTGGAGGTFPSAGNTFGRGGGAGGGGAGGGGANGGAGGSAGGGGGTGGIYGGGGGGGYGASGGNGSGAPAGSAGGKAVNTGSISITWTGGSASTSRVYGAVS